MKTTSALGLIIALIPTASSFSPARSSTTSFLLTRPSSIAPSPSAPTRLNMSAQQLAPQAVSLFNNMKTPASILAGAMVPMVMLAPLASRDQNKSEETRVHKILRGAYPVVGVLSLLSELISVMWATVAVNQLIETSVMPAASVWELLQRDFDLPWAAVNAHFTMGMLGFGFLVGCRAYFQAGTGLIGQGVAGLAGSGVLLMISIVNRGVASGGGAGERYGATVWSLIARYAFLLAKRASTPGSIGVLEISSIGLLVWSLVRAIKGIMERDDSVKKA